MDNASEIFSPPDVQVLKGTRPETGEPPSSRPQTPEVNPTASSTNLTVVGPAKAHITRTFAAATKVTKTGVHAIELFDGGNTAPSDEVLLRADKILTSLKTTKNQIDHLEEYVALKFEQPASRHLPNKQQLLLGVLNTIKQDELTTHRQRLGQTISELEMLLHHVNFSVTPFVPIPVEVLANYVSDEDEAQNIGKQHPLPPTLPDMGKMALESDTSVQPPAKSPLNPSPQHVTVQDNNRPADFKSKPQSIAQYQELIDNVSLDTSIKLVQLDQLKRDKRFLEKVQENHERATRAFVESHNTTPMPHPVNTKTHKPVLPAATQPDISKQLDFLCQVLLKMNDTQVQTQQMIENTPRAFIEQLEAFQNDGGSCKSSRISRASRAHSTKQPKVHVVNDSHAEGVHEAKDDHKPTYQPPPQKHHTPEAPSFHATPIVPMQSPHTGGLKLDTLLRLCPSYNGTGNLDMFINQFRDTILNVPEINSLQKYLVLANKITGTAKRYLVENENYEQAIEDTFDGLRNSYGKEDTQQNLLDKLYTLPLNQTDVSSMRHDIASHDQVARRLMSKGFQVTDDRLYNPLLAKLPARAREHMSMFLAKQGGIAYYNEVMNEVSILLDSVSHERAFLRCQAQVPVNEIPPTQAMIHFAQASANPNTKGLAPTARPWAYNPNNHATEYHDPITNTTLPGYYAPGSGGPNLTMMPYTFPYENDEPTTCKACGGKHSDIRCPLPSTEFRNLLKQKSLCPICAHKHAIEACRAGFRCVYCNGTHHMGSCPQKEHYRNPANYPAGAKKVQTFSSAPTKH